MAFGPTFRECKHSYEDSVLETEIYSYSELIYQHHIDLSQAQLAKDHTLDITPYSTPNELQVHNPTHQHRLLCPFRKTAAGAHPLTCSSFPPTPVLSILPSTNLSYQAPLNTFLPLSLWFRPLFLITAASSPLFRPPCCQSHLHKTPVRSQGSLV